MGATHILNTLDPSGFGSSSPGVCAGAIWEENDLEDPGDVRRLPSRWWGAPVRIFRVSGFRAYLRIFKFQQLPNGTSRAPRSRISCCCSIVSACLPSPQSLGLVVFPHGNFAILSQFVVQGLRLRSIACGLGLESKI